MRGMSLFEILGNFKDWSGSRSDLIALIDDMEQADPNTRMLRSKKAPYKRLPINARRIQWFISKKMMPNPIGHKYDYSHIVFYWTVIMIRKRDKLQFSEIEGLARTADVIFAGKCMRNKGEWTKYRNSISDDFSDRFETAGERGVVFDHGCVDQALCTRVLRMKFQDDIEVIVNENLLNKLNEKDIEILGSAFTTLLKELVKNKDGSENDE